MANLSRPVGFVPVGTLNAANWTGKVGSYLVPSSDGTALFIGDLVQGVAGAGTAGTIVAGQDVEGMQCVKQGTASSINIGVVVGFLPDPSAGLNVNNLYRLASTNRIALVSDDPDTIYECQEDGIGGAMTYANAGNNVSPVVNAGTTTTAMSGMLIDSSTAATTNTLTLRLMGLAKRSGNASGLSAKWLCMLNSAQYNNLIAGV